MSLARVMILLALVAAVAAQPCIECKVGAAEQLRDAGSQMLGYGIVKTMTTS
jgi:hypothetical protein